MKRYTQAEFDAFERDEKGIKYCPTGDYSQIENFGRLCNFGKCCRFGKYCCFGALCNFGECCSFGDRCSFGECCSFGDRCCFEEWCSFGECCDFGECCRFEEGCSFEKWCSFEECCSFGKRCSFGEQCSFGDRCDFEGIGSAKSGYPFAAWIGSGSRKGSKTYFFNLEQGVYVRCGCFLGTLFEFRKEVRETHGTDGLAGEYLAIADLVERKFAE